MGPCSGCHQGLACLTSCCRAGAAIRLQTRELLRRWWDATGPQPGGTWGIGTTCQHHGGNPRSSAVKSGSPSLSYPSSPFPPEQCEIPPWVDLSGEPAEAGPPPGPPSHTPRLAPAPPPLPPHLPPLRAPRSHARFTHHFGHCSLFRKPWHALSHPMCSAVYCNRPNSVLCRDLTI